MIKENQKALNTLFTISDALIVGVSLILAWYIRFNKILPVIDGYLSLSYYLHLLYVVVPLYLISFNVNGVYNPQRKNRFYIEVWKIIRSNLLSLAILVTALYVVKQIDVSRLVLLIFSVISSILIIGQRAAVRMILRYIRYKGYNQKHVVIVGNSQLTKKYIDTINSNKHLGYKINGIFDDCSMTDSTTLEVPLIGAIDELSRYLNNHLVDEVIIAISIGQYSKLEKIIRICEKNGVRCQIIPDYHRFIPTNAYVDDINGLQLVHIRKVPLDNVVYSLIKRLCDIIFASVALLVFSPVMLAIALTIKITSPGPIFFKQERVGLNKKNFYMYKFRSMHVATEEVAATKWTTKDDPRKTKFGSFIRKVSLDELPQILNVLKGEMSLVGPRPERPYFVKQYKDKIPKYMIKHQVRPGITGWAQVNGWRGDTSIVTRIEYDIHYIENWNLLFDVKILFMTIYKGFVNDNAY